MHLIDPQGHTRRAFLRRGAQLAVTGTALPLALNLSMMAEAAAQAAPASDDYRALVCIFLYGGNDCANTVIPYDDATYNVYSAIRGGGAGQTAGGIALAKASLTPTLLAPTTALPGGRQFALHPGLSALADLHNTSGKLAVQLNVGPLVVPVTRAQYLGGNRTLYPLPSKLFSHNDQQSVWQSSSPEGATVGWGGNIGDLVLARNSNATFTCIGTTGSAVFLSGDSAMSYQVSPGGGAVAINSVKNATAYGSSTVGAAMTQLLQQSRSHPMENEYNRVVQRSIAAQGSVTSAIGSAYPAGTFPTSGVGAQLAMVARLIRGRSVLGAKRQVFFVGVNGFDTHDDLLARHAALMSQLSAAMAAFHTEMIAQGLSNNVTQFTASEFGRTLASNGGGSDHGWGGHHFVLGGAVKGKDKLYGTAPVISNNDDSKLEGYEGHLDRGRLIPSTSVDQYAATLATWFGVPVAELNAILPNLKNFGGSVNGIDYPKNLGFMS